MRKFTLFLFTLFLSTTTVLGSTTTLQKAELKTIIYEEKNEIVDVNSKDKYTIGYNIQIPNIVDPLNYSVSKKFNAAFNEKAKLQKMEIDKIFKEQQQSNQYYNVEYDLNYQVKLNVMPILSILVEEYEYMGGAHGLPSSYGVTLDFYKDQVLLLSDLFREGYEQVLIDKMNLIIEKNPDDYEGYDGTIKINELPKGKSPFYLTDDYLTIFYQPYELAPYARGFVEFNIPLSDIEPILKDEYKKIAE